VTAVALMWILTNSVFTVVATVFRSKFMKDKNFTVSTPLAMCSVTSAAIPLVFVSAYVTGETEQWNHALFDTPPTAWFFATMSGLVAGCFSFLQFRCQKVISGTSDLMFQNFVKIFIIIMGIVAFGDSFTMESLAGCTIALGGCAWYGKERMGKEVAGDKAKSGDLKEPLMSKISVSSQSGLKLPSNYADKLTGKVRLQGRKWTKLKQTWKQSNRRVRGLPTGRERNTVKLSFSGGCQHSLFYSERLLKSIQLQ